MNTTDYFTNINAMFLFCIFTCGLLVWAVIRGYILKGKLLKEQDSHLKATNTNTLLNKALSAKNVLIQATEHKLRDAEKEIRELQGELSHAFSSNIALQDKLSPLITKLTAAEKELEATKAKVRKRDKDGKFLPSGKGRVRTPKKLKLVTDLRENEVIHCKTAEEKKAICRLMHEAGLRWVLGGSYMEEEHGDYGSEHCYRPKAGIQSPLSRFQKEGRIIHPASDFIARPKRVKKVSLKVSADITAVQDAIQGVKAASNELSNHAKEASAALDNFSELVSTTTLPKLVHGLTVKNPTEAEAKMIFDEAMRLGLSTYAENRIDLPFIWWSVTDAVSRCADSDWPVYQIFVTAKEFVQRMQNGRE